MPKDFDPTSPLRRAFSLGLAATRPLAAGKTSMLPSELALMLISEYNKVG